MITPPLISVRLLSLFDVKALFISASNRYQKKIILSAFRDWVKRLQNCDSVKGEYLKVCSKNMFDKT